MGFVEVTMNDPRIHQCSGSGEVCSLCGAPIGAPRQHPPFVQPTENDALPLLRQCASKIAGIETVMWLILVTITIYGCTARWK